MSSPRSQGQTRALTPLESPNGKSWRHRRGGIVLVDHYLLLLMAVELVIGGGARIARAVGGVGVVGQNRSFGAAGKDGEDEVGFGSGRSFDYSVLDWEPSLSLSSGCIDYETGLGEGGCLARVVRRGSGMIGRSLRVVGVGERSIPEREQGRR